LSDSVLATQINLTESMSVSRERWGLRTVLLCSLAGLLVAAYLVKLHAAIAGKPSRGLCTFNDTLSCDKVLASPYAEIAGIPVALMGLLGFGLVFGLAAWRLCWGDRSPRPLPAILALMAGVGLLFELGMTWVEVFVIQAICPYCLTAFGLIAASFVAAVIAWRARRHTASLEVGRG
jgi:uncharacterized membrane protein